VSWEGHKGFLLRSTTARLDREQVVKSFHITSPMTLPSHPTAADQCALRGIDRWVILVFWVPFRLLGLTIVLSRRISTHWSFCKILMEVNGRSMTTISAQFLNQSIGRVMNINREC
jgi:hypothetical protein